MDIFRPILKTFIISPTLPHPPSVLANTYAYGHIIYWAKQCVDYVTGEDLDGLGSREIRLISYKDIFNSIGTFVVNLDDFETDDVIVCAERWRKRISSMPNHEFKTEEYSTNV